MSLALIDGAEHRIPVPPLMSTTTVGSAAYQTNGRYGGITYFNSGQFFRWTVPAAVADAEFWMGVAVMHDPTISGTAANVLLAVYGDGVTTLHLSLYANSSGVLSLYRGDVTTGTLLGSTAAGTILVSTWYYLELYAIIDNATGAYEVRVDGANVLSASGVDTRNGGTDPAITIFQLGRASTNQTYYDDIYFVTGDGSGLSGFQSEISIEGIKPNGAGNYTQLTPTGSATNWQNVDEVPFSSADYNGSSTPGQKDTYAYANLTATTGTIIGSVIHFAAFKNLAGFIKGRRVIRISSTDYNGTDTPSLSATTRYFSELMPVSVATAAAWTISEVNGLEAGFEVRSA